MSQGSWWEVAAVLRLHEPAVVEAHLALRETHRTLLRSRQRGERRQAPTVEVEYITWEGSHRGWRGVGEGEEQGGKGKNGARVRQALRHRGRCRGH